MVRPPLLLLVGEIALDIFKQESLILTSLSTGCLTTTILP